MEAAAPSVILEVVSVESMSARGSEAEATRGRSCRAGLVLVVVLALLLGTTACAGPLDEAASAEAEGDLPGAVELYEEILAQDPDNVEALDGIGVDLMALGRYDEALGYQEQLVALDDEAWEIRVDLGFNYLNHQGRPADAAEVLSEAARVEPTAQNLTFLAQALIALESTEEAEETLRKAIEADGSYPWAYQVLAGLLRDLGREQDLAALVTQAGTAGIVISTSDESGSDR